MNSVRDAAATERAFEVLMLLRRIIRATDLRSRRLVKATGLTTPQIVMLQAISDLGEVTAGRLSEHVSLSPATVSTILDRLEGRGLIQRYRSARDRRVVHAALTERGQQALAAPPGVLHENFVERFERLGRQQQVTIIRSLQTVVELMGARDLDDEALADQEAGLR